MNNDDNYKNNNSKDKKHIYPNLSVYFKVEAGLIKLSHHNWTQSYNYYLQEHFYSSLL